MTTLIPAPAKSPDREAFEKEFSQQIFDRYRYRPTFNWLVDERYLDGGINSHWKIWQAATAAERLRVREALPSESQIEKGVLTWLQSGHVPLSLQIAFEIGARWLRDRVLADCEGET